MQIKCYGTSALSTSCFQVLTHVSSTEPLMFRGFNVQLVGYRTSFRGTGFAFFLIGTIVPGKHHRLTGDCSFLTKSRSIHLYNTTSIGKNLTLLHDTHAFAQTATSLITLLPLSLIQVSRSTIIYHSFDYCPHAEWSVRVCTLAENREVDTAAAASASLPNSTKHKDLTRRRTPLVRILS